MRTFFIIVAASLLTAATGWCHGVEGSVDQTTAHCVTARYDDGEPMSYAAVEITAPQTEVAFQTGRTDRNGCFTVKTDTPGPWLAVVSDGMGHRLTLDFTVNSDTGAPAAATAPAAPARSAMDRPLQVVAGLSIIFGLCGFIYGWKARRSTRL